MKEKRAGQELIEEIASRIVRDSFISTNFKVETSGEWKNGETREYRDRVVLVPEEPWLDTCGNGFAIESYEKDGSVILYFGIRSPYTAPRNLEYKEELALITENIFEKHSISFETLYSSSQMDSYWRVWTSLDYHMDDIDFLVEDIAKLINEVFVEREKLVRPDYLIF